MTLEQALDTLRRHRRDIDRIDIEILRLLNDRTRVVEKIGSIKEEFGMPVYEPKREDEVYRNITEHNSGPLPPEAVKRIFERLIDEMRTLQSLKLSRDREGAVPRTDQ